jgi:hypothetical protein
VLDPFLPFNNAGRRIIEDLSVFRPQFNRTTKSPRSLSICLRWRGRRISLSPQIDGMQGTAGHAEEGN